MKIFLYHIRTVTLYTHHIDTWYRYIVYVTYHKQNPIVTYTLVSCRIWHYNDNTSGSERQLGFQHFIGQVKCIDTIYALFERVTARSANSSRNTTNSHMHTTHYTYYDSFVLVSTSSYYCHTDSRQILWLGVWHGGKGKWRLLWWWHSLTCNKFQTPCNKIFVTDIYVIFSQER